MKRIVLFSITLILSNTQLFAQQQNPLDIQIRFQPDSLVYVYETLGPEMSKSLTTAVIQNMAVVNQSDQTINIDKINFEAFKQGRTLQHKNIYEDKMRQSAAKYRMLQEAGYLELYDFQFQTSQYLKGIALAAGDTLRSNEGLILTHETFLFEEVPDSIEVTVWESQANQEVLLTQKSLKVVNHQSKNKYVLPLKGSWTTAAGPSLIGHHRWGSIQEFAYDFIKIGQDQKSFANNGTQLEDFYAYGEDVFAVADGVVVAAMNTITESSDNLKRPDETDIAYMKRMMPYQNELMAKGFEYVFGNHVIIQHAHKEYSSYFHLKHGSVTVKKGDKVQQGQLIGQLGHSGNSTEPHLHFHLSDGADIMHSRSIPIEFENINLFPADNGKVRHIHTGQILSTRE